MSSIETTVVNLRKSAYDVYIGRETALSPDKVTYHYGNPFTHISYGHGVIKVATRDEAVQCFSDWLAGKAYHDVEPTRREWILANTRKLKGKKLGCFCKPSACHGDVLARLANENN